jgi:hypothetical protein
MKTLLPYLIYTNLFLYPALTGFGQCGYRASLTTSKDYCIGSTLSVNGDHGLRKIVWYRNGVPVDSAMALSSLDTNGVTVAGTGGRGSGPNQLINPTGIAVDESDNLFVADAGNDRIQEWRPGATAG